VTTPEEFAALLAAPEGARLECKAARGGFHFEELVKYVVALANEGGGSVVLGAEDNRPRRVVGTTAFPSPGAPRRGSTSNCISESQSRSTTTMASESSLSTRRRG